MWFNHVLFSDIIETSAILGDGLTDCMDWLAGKLGSNSSPAKKSAPQSLYQRPLHEHSPSKKIAAQNTPKSSNESSPTHCDRNVEVKDKTAHKDYCTRAYSAFKCFFIRPNVPPDISDWQNDDLRFLESCVLQSKGVNCIWCYSHVCNLFIQCRSKTIFTFRLC